jgi:hypothetical protein
VISGGLGGSNLTGDDDLEPQDGRSRHHHGIEARLWHRAVRAAPEQLDLEAVGYGSDNARAPTDRSCRSNHHVLAKHDSRFRETLQGPVIYHGLCAFRGLFTGLEDRYHRSLPSLSRPCEQCAGAHEPRHVHVMVAGMHYRHRFAHSEASVFFALMAALSRLHQLRSHYKSHSIGNIDRNQTPARCQKLVPGSVSCRTDSSARRSIQYSFPASDRRTS